MYIFPQKFHISLFHTFHWLELSHMDKTSSEILHKGHSSLQYYYTPQTLVEIMWMTTIKIIFLDELWS